MTVTAGGAIFPRLKTLGVDNVFANSGTDFPPIIEGLAQAAEAGVALPEATLKTSPYAKQFIGSRQAVPVSIERTD